MKKSRTNSDQDRENLENLRPIRSDRSQTRLWVPDLMLMCKELKICLNLGQDGFHHYKRQNHRLLVGVEVPNYNPIKSYFSAFPTLAIVVTVFPRLDLVEDGFVLGQLFEIFEAKMIET